MTLMLALALLQGASPPGEEPVDPYVVSDVNAGATPHDSPALLAAFNGREGIGRIVDTFVDINFSDPRTADIFRGHDQVRIRRTLKEQFCYLLGGGCAYTGRDMKASHKDMGVQAADFNAVVENLQAAMRKEGVPFFAQNRLLAKLAPMKRDVVER